MTVGVQQLQVVARLAAASTAPDPLVDLPGLLVGAKDLPAHIHRPSCLFQRYSIRPRPARIWVGFQTDPSSSAITRILVVSLRGFGAGFDREAGATWG